MIHGAAAFVWDCMSCTGAQTTYLLLLVVGNGGKDPYNRSSHRTHSHIVGFIILSIFHSRLTTSKTWALPACVASLR